MKLLMLACCQIRLVTSMVVLRGTAGVRPRRRTGGFTKAGDSLQLPKTTVSDLVQSLEKHLGVRLLQRTTRRVTVTPDGVAFYERCAHLLADLDEAEASVMQARVAPKGRLRVDMPSGLARLFIIPRLPSFLARYPDLRLELGLGLRPAHLLEEGIDCVVRFGMQLDSSLVARRICTMSLLCCASPAYLRERGTPLRPEELSAHRCVNYVSNRTGRVHGLGVRARRTEGPAHTQCHPASHRSRRQCRRRSYEFRNREGGELRSPTVPGVGAT